MKKILSVTGYILFTLLVFLAFLSYFSAEWFLQVFGSIGFNSILYTIFSGMNGASSELTGDYMLHALLPAAAEALIILLLVLLPKLWHDGKHSRKKKIHWNRLLAGIFSVLSLGVICYSAHLVEADDYLNGMLHQTAVYDEDYVPPAEVEITFPEKKKNLIYIIMESMETSYLSEELGGAEEEDLIPELYELAQNNINFSATDGVGGWSSIYGTGWTVASMVAQTAGVPLTGPVDSNDYGNYDTFLPGAVSINNILHDNGYYQTLMVGSDASFGGRDKYFSQHGVDRVYDYYTAMDDGIIPEGYYVWWGMEDKYLYEYAKQELTEIASQDQPFAFTMLTVDTHHVGGYECELCDNEYEESLDNVIRCASRQVFEFVQWIMAQDFYEDTVIIICGDHPSMDEGYSERNLDVNYENRYIYNCILHSGLGNENSKGRAFTAFDMFPTTLAAMGCEIEGDRLGLGVNLFSGEQTLLEKYGNYYLLHGELAKSSNYYNTNLLYNHASGD